MSSISLQDWAPYRALSEAWGAGAPRLRASGLTGGARALVVRALLGGQERPTLVLASGLVEVQRWAGDLRFFGARVLELIPPPPRVWRGGRHRESEGEHALVCDRLLAGEPAIVVSTPAGLTSPLRSPDAFRARTFRLGVGDRLDRELLLEELAGAGYERVDTVAEVGDWSVRGGILDVFSPACPSPARIELFGDEIESIRLFDPTSQRSTTTLEEIRILPLAEGAGEANLLAYLPADAAVVLDDPGLLDAPPDDAPAAEPLGELLGDRRRLELVILGAVAGRAGEKAAPTSRGSSVPSTSSSPAGSRRERVYGWSPAIRPRPSACVGSCASTAGKRFRSRRSGARSRSA